jgi:hypothetical protein
MCALPNNKGASGSEKYFGSIGRKLIETKLSAFSATCDPPATRASSVVQVLANIVKLNSLELRKLDVSPRAL